MGIRQLITRFLINLLSKNRQNTENQKEELKKNIMQETSNNPSSQEINDTFWLGLAKTWVENQIDSFQKAGTEIQNLLKWVLGIFTTGSVISSFLEIELSRNIAYLFGLTFLVALTTLILSYHNASKMLLPTPKLLAENSADKIRKAYESKTQELNGLKKKANAYAGVAFTFFSLSFGILILGQFKTDNLEDKVEFSGNFVEELGGKNNNPFLLIKGDFYSDKPIFIRSIPISDSITIIDSYLIPKDSIQSISLNDSIGLVFPIPISKKESKYYVEVAWAEGNVLKTIGKTFKVPSPKNK